MKTVAASISVALMFAATAAAQSRLFATPSLAVAEVADNNIFVTAAPAESDRILRMTPGLRAGYLSPTFQLSGGYSCDAERYDAHPQLDNALARQQGAADLKYTPTPRLALAASASYLRTNSPQDLNLDTSLTVTRTLADGARVTPSATFKFSARDEGRIRFEWTRDRFLGFAIDAAPGFVDARELLVGFDRKLGPTDTAGAEYRVRWFSIAAVPGLLQGISDYSQVVLIGWTHKLTRLTDMTVSIGPRVQDGGTLPEWSASVRQRLARGDIALAFGRAQSVALGEADVMDTQRLTLTATVRPIQRLELRAAPSLTSDNSGGGQRNATVGMIDASASGQISRWLSLLVSYHSALERMSAPIVGASTIRQTVFMVQLVAHPVTRRSEGI